MAFMPDVLVFDFDGVILESADIKTRGIRSGGSMRETDRPARQGGLNYRQSANKIAAVHGGKLVGLHKIIFGW